MPKGASSWIGAIIEVAKELTETSSETQDRWREEEEEQRDKDNRRSDEISDRHE